MTINQLSVFIENKRGRLAEITKILKESGVDIRAAAGTDILAAAGGLVKIAGYHHSYGN